MKTGRIKGRTSLSGATALVKNILGTIYYKTESEIEKIRESSLIVSKTLAEVGKAIKPG